MPRIYAACLASYNAGILHGAWINVDHNTTEASIRDEIAEMLKASPTPEAEEYAIHDYDGFPFPDRWSYSENPVWDDLLLLVETMHSYGEEATAAALTISDDEREAREWLDNGFRCGTTKAEIAEEYCNDLGYVDEAPEPLRSHIDFDSFARSHERDGVWKFARVKKPFLSASYDVLYCFYT